MERAVERAALLGQKCGGTEVQKTSRDREETSFHQKGFSFDAVSSRKPSGTTKSNDGLPHIPSWNSQGPMGDGGGRQSGKQIERENCGDTKTLGPGKFSRR